MSGTLDDIQRIEVFFEPREVETNTQEMSHGQYLTQRKLVGSVEIRAEDWGEIGKPRHMEGALQLVAIRENQVKEWYFPAGKWDRMEITATRKGGKKDES